MKEKKLRIEDALSATKAAVEEGTVAGGGVALLRTKAELEKAVKKADNNDIKTGIAIVLKAIEAPMRQIATNAGIEGSVIINEIFKNKSKTYGFDFAKEDYVDMFEAGIIDPTKVTRSAIENSCSIAGMILTTESLVTDIPDPAAEAAANAAMASAAGAGGMY